MKTLAVATLPQIYKNKGQQAQVEFIYTLTGIITKADNIAFNKGTDYGIYQIKSARATVCKGTDIQAHLSEDLASEYVYVSKAHIAYIMTKAEYLQFATLFTTVTRESKKNGGATKLRLKDESQAMLGWLSQR